MKKYLLRGLMVGVSLLMLSGLASSVDALGMKPPKPPKPPISVSEPATLGLLGAGIAGVGAYLLMRRKNRK